MDDRNLLGDIQGIELEAKCFIKVNPLSGKIKRVVNIDRI
jgi:hypothetical protein